MTVGDSSADSSVPPSDATGPTSASPATQPETEQQAPATQPDDAPAAPAPGPLARLKGPLAARGLGIAKPASPVATESGSTQRASGSPSGKPKSGDQPMSAASGKPASGERSNSGERSKSHPRPRLAGESKADAGDSPRPAGESEPRPRSKVAVPNRRAALPDDILAELEAELAAADVEAILSSSAGMPDRREPLTDGARVHAQVLKIHNDSVFISLGGPDEGYVPLEQFTGEEPVPGQSIEVLVRGMNREDGLYIATLPGQTVDVSDWEDLEEGAVVEATITGSNAGGLECKVGNIRGFIPISQVAEYRVEDLSEFVEQRMVCLVTEANPNRGNLVLSRRGILEREREEKRREQLEKLEPGDTLEGTVRSVKDFGAFVDLGGLDGLIHVSKLSWERVKHPSEVLQEGQKVKVKIDTIDKQTGKIGLSYRDLLENPWDTAEATFAAGTVHRGTVTRIANFGAFVRLAAGIEGLVHISEMANHRVSKVDSLVSPGDEIDVKVLSFDRDAQKIGLSMKAAQAKPETPVAAEPEDEPPREPAVKPMHSGPLRGGNNRDVGGERFGLRW